MSFAQQIRVEKVKGNKAIVEISSGSLVPGKTYNLGGGSSYGGTSASGGGSRHNFLAGSFVLRSESGTVGGGGTSGTLKENDMNLQGRYGWNMEQYEAGPIVTYRNVDSDSQGVHYSSIAAGAFGDYNFTLNRPGESTIFAVTGEGTYGTYSPKTGSGGNIMAVFLGGTLKWFGFSNTAIRGDLGYDYQKLTAGTQSLTTTGFALRLGFATYF